VLSNNYCEINIATVLAAPYNVDGGDHIWAKVSAANVYGESAQSSAGNDAMYTRVPDSPISLAEDSLQRTATTIGITWADGSNNGGVAITNYKIEYRAQGGSTFTEAGTTASKAFSITPLTLGTTYEIQVSAENSVGYSDPSALFTILHAIRPDQPSAPATVNSGTDIVVTWTAPTANGSPITSFQILFQQQDGQFSEEATYCDGSDPAVLTCTIPQSVFEASPYSLVLGDLVRAKVDATNVKGTSDASAVGGSATIIQVPDAPLTLTENTSERTPTSLGLQWTAGNSNGGSAILDYRVQSRAVGGTYSDLVTVDANTLSYVATSLTSGTTYEFRVYARNQFGDSLPSSELQLLAAYIPDVPTNVVTSIVDAKVKV
jgi:hypothetical protein